MTTPKPNTLLIALALLAGVGANAAPLGTAFTYQGRLTDNGTAVNGLYDMQFTLYDAASNGVVKAGPLTNSAVAVSNGLFATTIDFGGGAFNGDARWLETGALTNGSGGAFPILGPRQALTPTPYAIMAAGASNLLGTLPAAQLGGTVGNSQLANNSITVYAGTGLSGGGVVPLGGWTTLSNVGVLSVTGNSNITVSTVGGAVTLGDTATAANTPSTIVKRDAGGNFSAGTITLNANLNLPATTTTAGIIYAGGSLLLHGDTNQNFFVGVSAGNVTLTGGGNTGIGIYALTVDTSGYWNTASGAGALSQNTTGYDNTANGAWALLNNTSGSQNTANGQGALLNNTNGSGNTANGAWALQRNTSGNDNTANGEAALFYNTIGSNNTANGVSALQNNTSGSYNTANGVWALYNNTNGVNNTANGYQALYNNTSGYDNTADGYQALMNTTNDNELVAIGYQALQNDNAYNPGLNTDSGNGENTAIGFQALQMNTSGFANAAIGYLALNRNTIGGANTADGARALLYNTSGYANTANGALALNRNTSGSYNTAIGYEALCFNTNGNNNIALGYQVGNLLKTGNNNIYIGNPGATTETGTIRIGTQGTQTNTFIAGISGVTISPSGGAVYINSAGQLGTVNSSRRFKEGIRDMGDQSDVLLSLRPVAFRYKPDLDPQGTPQFGLIAEEVEKVAPGLVLHDAQGEVYSVRYEQVNAMLLNEFLKQHRRVEEQEQKLTVQDAQIETLSAKAARVDSLEKRMAELENMVQSLADRK